MIEGQPVSVTTENAIVRGRIVVGSDNLKSLLVIFDKPLCVNGDLKTNFMILSFIDEGVYRDMLTEKTVGIEWEPEAQEETKWN